MTSSGKLTNVHGRGEGVVPCNRRCVLAAGQVQPQPSVEHPRFLRLVMKRQARLCILGNTISALHIGLGAGRSASRVLAGTRHRLCLR